MVMRLVLPLPPSSNRYWRSVNGRVLVSKEGREYRDRCAFAAALQWKHALVEGRLAFRADVYRDLRGDLDNMLHTMGSANQPPVEKAVTPRMFTSQPCALSSSRKCSAFLLSNQPSPGKLPTIGKLKTLARKASGALAFTNQSG